MCTAHCASIGERTRHNFISFPAYFFPFFINLSQPNIKAETCSCAQNAHLEILSPAVIRFLSFYYGKLAKIRSKACYSDSISYFFFINCKVGFFIFQLQLDLSPKRIKLETSGCSCLKELEILFPTLT